MLVLTGNSVVLWPACMKAGNVQHVVNASTPKITRSIRSIWTGTTGRTAELQLPAIMRLIVANGTVVSR